MSVSNDDKNWEIYSFTEVQKDEDKIYVIPNGGMNGSTVLANNKDLNGLLDFIDSNVLEKGRTINREMFYDLLAIMLVDKDLSTDFERTKKNMVMVLATTNNFYGYDIGIRVCYLIPDYPTNYYLLVEVPSGKDIWVLNFAERTLLIKEGTTVYTSDMFSDKYLAIWLTAIEQYYES